jgi:hypothetical protein
MQKLTDRNRTSHTYNEETAEAILTNIQMQHHPLLKALEQTMFSRVDEAREFGAVRGRRSIEGSAPPFPQN